MSAPDTGKVFLIGAGPGDPELMTVRAARLLAEADLILYDNLVGDGIHRLFPETAERQYVGKKPGFHLVTQDEIHTRIIAAAKAGKRVVRLKGGDPYLFGRAAEEGQALAAAGIPFEVVPGVTAAFAAAAERGLPLTLRGVSTGVVFITGHEAPGKEADSLIDYAHLARLGRNQTLALYMGIRNLALITQRFLEAGLPPETPAAAVMNATLPSQKMVRTVLGELAEAVGSAGLGAPTIILIGESLRDAGPLDWTASRPLLGRRIVLTRMPEQAAPMAEALREAGAEVLEMPLIQIRRDVDPNLRDQRFAAIGGYDWLLFTSANGVRYFLDEFFDCFPDIRALGLIRIAAVGQATAAALANFHIRPDLIPAQADADSLANALIKEGSVANLRMLLVTGNRSHGALSLALEKEGAMVDTFPVYRNESVDLSGDPAATRFRQEGADAIVFASGSAVESFIDQARHLVLAPDARRPLACSIGPRTTEVMKERKLPVDCEAAMPSLEGVVEALIRRLGG